MASCDALACFTYWVSPERRAADAELNTARLGALYSSYVVETDKQMEEAMRRAHTSLCEIRRLTVGGVRADGGALVRAKAEGKAAALRVRELRERSEKYARLASSCERAIFQLQEAKQYRETVGALAGVQTQFKNMKLDKLLRGAETAANEVSDAESNLTDIGNILGAPVAPSMFGSSSAADDAEVEAELAALLGEAAPPAPAPAPPRAAGGRAQPQAEGSRVPALPSAADYESALQTAS